MTPAPSANQPFRSCCLGGCLKGCAATLFLLLLAVSSFLAPFVGAAIAVVMAAMWWAGRSLTAPTVEQLLQRDKRPPVLYLRSFRLDEKLDRSVQHRLEKIVPRWLSLCMMPVDLLCECIDRLPGMKAVNRWTGDGMEETVVASLAKIGPVIAIGKPGDKLAPPGAAREYLGDDEWQQRVIQRLHQSALVVMQPGVSGQVVWEINTALNFIDPRRLILLFWQTSDDGYREFVRSAAGRIPLPPVEARAGAELVRFDATGTPRFERIPTNGAVRTFFDRHENLNALATKLRNELSALPPIRFEQTA